MSLIGPRPELVRYTNQYEGEEKDILKVRPGITDFSSVEFINLDEIVGGENADGLKNFVFRLPTIYLWASEDQYFVDGIKRKIGYRILIDRAISGEVLEVWGDPSRVKDMVYVKDFCQMLYKALFVKREKGHYNVGTGVGTSLLDQIKGIAEVFCWLIEKIEQMKDVSPI